MPVIKIKKLDNFVGLPVKATKHASGYDILSTLDKVLKPGEKINIPVGFDIWIPNGHEIRIKSRSSLTHTHAIILTDSVGTIDNDFRGEMEISLLNLGKEPYHISKGDRIAQMSIHELVYSEIVEVNEIPYDTDRGRKKIGSSGK